MSNIKGKIYYTEQQSFRVGWLWALILISVVGSVGVMLVTLFIEDKGTSEPWIVTGIVVPFEMVMVYLFYAARLETTVTTDGMWYRWTPFQRTFRHITREEIAAKLIRKGPALSYGFHYIPGYGRVHNTGPGEGVQLELRNGKKIYFGSREPAMFLAALDRAERDV